MEITFPAPILPVNKNTVLTSLYFLCLGPCEIRSRDGTGKEINISRQMGIRLKAELENRMKYYLKRKTIMQEKKEAV